LLKAQKITETELVTQLRKRSSVHFSYLYDNYSGALYGMVLKNVSNTDEAADLLQEVFVKIYKNIDSYDEKKGKLFTWMINICRNTCIDHLRSASHSKDLKNQNIDLSVNEINRSNNVEQAVEQIGLANLVNKLPDNQSELIELVYFKGYTQEEASKALNIPLGTVKTRVRTAIITLRGFYKELNHGN
jgi:RNA polymerase sigma factor (sigma-70 family)